MDFTVGTRVVVDGGDPLYGRGTVKFVGKHHSMTDEDRVGIELDEPNGKNNGTIKVSMVRNWLAKLRRTLTP